MEKIKSKPSNSHFNFVTESNIFSKSKHSQVTIFIIIAVLIIVVIGVFFIIKGSALNLGKERINPEVQPIYSFVEQCIKETGYNGVDYVSKTGGYFVVPELSTESNVAYYLYEGKNYMPSKEQVEIEISKYTDEMLMFCIKEFSDFPEFKIEQGEIKTQTTIEDDKVILKINYPLSISKGDNSYSFDDFETEVLVRLGVVYDVVSKIMESHFDDKSICIDCIYELCDESDLKLSVMREEETSIFSLIDENSKINNENLVFNFANKYNAFEWE